MVELMELIENENGYLEPYNASDVPLFMHCTSGSASITYSFFGDLTAVFACHGVKRFKRLKGDNWEILN